MGGTGPAFANSWIPLFYAPETLVRLYSSICLSQKRSSLNLSSAIDYVLVFTGGGVRQPATPCKVTPIAPCPGQSANGKGRTLVKVYVTREFKKSSVALFLQFANQSWCRNSACWWWCSSERVFCRPVMPVRPPMECVR